MELHLSIGWQVPAQKGERVKLLKLLGEFGKFFPIVPLGCSPVEGVTAIVIGFSCL